MEGNGDSEWRIRSRAREEEVVVRGGSTPGVFVGGQLVDQVIPEPYGHLLALQHPGAHLQSVEETSPRDVSTSGSETTVVCRYSGERIVTLTINEFGWVLTKTVRTRGDLTEALELTDPVYGPEPARPSSPRSRAFHDLQTSPSWSMGS